MVRGEDREKGRYHAPNYTTQCLAFRTLKFLIHAKQAHKAFFEAL